MQKQAGCKNRQDAKTGRMQKQAGCKNRQDAKTGRMPVPRIPDKEGVTDY
jgi:hypothetical protein